ncbi:MAG TPA: hypothetical protein VF142_09930 [Longimicrobium sp.]
MYKRIHLSGALVLALAACEQNPVRALPAQAGPVLLEATTGAAPVYGGSENDYQPSLIRAADGRLMIVLERLAPRTNSGDLYVSTSSNGGASWSTPALIVGTRGNERHPSLVQHPSGSFSLFYLLVDKKGAYHIHRATSTNGTTWTQRGAVNLGWTTAGNMNPSVIIEADGSLTMTYQRYTGTEYVGYIARSTDGGATWDSLRTTITDGTQGMLPRVAKRASDGLYMVTFQATGPGGTLEIYARTSTDPYSWSGPRTTVSMVADSHDSQPIVLEDGRFLVTYIGLGTDSGYNLYYRTTDGSAWAAPVKLTTDAAQSDVEPHPILHGTPGHVVLSWGRQSPAGHYDIWVNPDLAIQ